MILAAQVPKVDVIPDGFDWVNILIGLGGFAVAITAILLARRAQKSADQGIAEERRRAFELDILRDLVRDLDEGKLLDQVYLDPLKLRVYELRLSLLSSPLPFWQKVMTLETLYDVTEAVGLAEYQRVDQRHAVASEDKNYIPGAIELLPYLNHQSNQARENVLNRLSKWITDPPDRVAPPEAWEPTSRILKAILGDLRAEVPELSVRRKELWAAGKVELRRRLAWDVEQAILSRVEARRPKRPRWWFRV